MSYWTVTVRPALTGFFKDRWSFLTSNIFDVLFWCVVSAVVGRLAL